jgi:transcriptional regulator with XRE-family HTH domain
VSKFVNPLKRIFLFFSLLFSGFGVLWLQGGEFMTSIGNKSVMAKNLTYYVNRSGKTQKELSEIVGVATSTFNDWMKGKKYPRIDKIEMLANYFGILKSDLIEDSDQKNPPSEPTLTEGEKMVLELFRKIPEDRQAAALELLRAALKMQ